MKRRLLAFLLGVFLLTGAAGATGLTLDGAPLDLGETPLLGGVTYVPLRGLVQAAHPDAKVTWENGRATARWDGTTLTAVPGESFLTCNGARIDLPLPVRLEKGRTLVPLRPLCALLELDVSWEPASASVRLSRKVPSGYSGDDLYWLSRIISAESKGESWEGKIAVGNVVLNRVRSREFPDTIYGVIFDMRWGGQFEPVRNGAVYDAPTDESVRAAIACMNGENTVGDSLYFLAPSRTSNHWTMKNRDYVTTIGTHWFYK